MSRRRGIAFGIFYAVYSLGVVFGSGRVWNGVGNDDRARRAVLRERGGRIGRAADGDVYTGRPRKRVSPYRSDVIVSGA